MLGDYYFQSGGLAETKQNYPAKLAEHGLIYFAVCIIFIIPVFNTGIFIGAILLAASHIIIDTAKCFFIRRIIRAEEYTPNQERYIYLADQLVHIACIFIISFILVSYGVGLYLLPAVEIFFQMIELSFGMMLYWIIMLLLIWKPANVTIKQLLCLNRPVVTEGKRAGGFIGVLERLIILLFLSIGQYPAIGLVLTAKSIARYDEISKNKDFAEYYLLGTLLSTFIVIGAYLLVF